MIACIKIEQHINYIGRTIDSFAVISRLHETDSFYFNHAFQCTNDDDRNSCVHRNDAMRDVIIRFTQTNYGQDATCRMSQSHIIKYLPLCIQCGDCLLTACCWFNDRVFGILKYLFATLFIQLLLLLELFLSMMSVQVFHQIYMAMTLCSLSRIAYVY